MDQERFVVLIGMKKLCMGMIRDSDLSNEKIFTGRWRLLDKF